MVTVVVGNRHGRSSMVSISRCHRSVPTCTPCTPERHTRAEPGEPRTQQTARKSWQSHRHCHPEQVLEARVEHCTRDYPIGCGSQHWPALERLVTRRTQRMAPGPSLSASTSRRPSLPRVAPGCICALAPQTGAHKEQLCGMPLASADTPWRLKGSRCTRVHHAIRHCVANKCRRAVLNSEEEVVIPELYEKAHDGAVKEAPMDLVVSYASPGTEQRIRTLNRRKKVTQQEWQMCGLTDNPQEQTSCRVWNQCLTNFVILTRSARSFLTKLQEELKAASTNKLE